MNFPVTKNSIRLFPLCLVGLAAVMAPVQSTYAAGVFRDAYNTPVYGDKVNYASASADLKKAFSQLEDSMKGFRASLAVYCKDSGMTFGQVAKSVKEQQASLGKQLAGASKTKAIVEGNLAKVGAQGAPIPSGDSLNLMQEASTKEIAALSQQANQAKAALDGLSGARVTDSHNKKKPGSLQSIEQTLRDSIAFIEQSVTHRNQMVKYCNVRNGAFAQRASARTACRGRGTSKLDQSYCGMYQSLISALDNYQKVRAYLAHMSENKLPQAAAENMGRLCSGETANAASADCVAYEKVCAKSNNSSECLGQMQTLMSKGGPQLPEASAAAQAPQSIPNSDISGTNPDEENAAKAALADAAKAPSEISTAKPNSSGSASELLANEPELVGGIPFSERNTIPFTREDPENPGIPLTESYTIPFTDNPAPYTNSTTEPTVTEAPAAQPTVNESSVAKTTKSTTRKPAATPAAKPVVSKVASTKRGLFKGKLFKRKATKTKVRKVRKNSYKATCTANNPFNPYACK